jgi:hypothetical protein
VDAGTPGGGAAAREPPRGFSTALRLWAVAAAAAAVYAAIALADRAASIGLPDSVKVGVPFLLLPLVGLRLLKQPYALGSLDRTFLLSAASYVPYAIWASAAAGSAPWFYRPVADSVSSFPFVLWWSADTFFHVGAVDYFTKRVVQREVEARAGRWNALWLQWGVWSAGHVVEWLWLRLILGDTAAALFLVSAGLVTGLAYMRWKNVLGLMVGHFLVNVAAAAAAVALYR